MDKILKQFGEEKILESVKKANSFVEATLFIGLDPKNINVKKNVERSIKRLGISTDHFDSVKRLKDSKNRYTKEKLEYLVKKCKTYSDILKELDILPITNNFNTLKKKLNEYNIDFSHLKNQRKPFVRTIWIKEKIEKFIKESNTQKEVLEKMGIRSAGGNFGTLKKYIKLYNIDTSHFLKNYYVISELSRNKKIPLSEILIENSNYNKLKERLYDEGLKERKCELCGQDENWKGKRMSLILDHKNGIHNDNRFENLQIVCPNCNATLPTYCRKHN